jgi:carboxyl-terminal processing protease
MSSRSGSWTLLLPLVAAIGCGSSDPAAPTDRQTGAKPAAPAAADDAEPVSEKGQPDAPEAGDGQCRDYSKFDVSTLPKIPHSEYSDLLEQVWTVVLEKHYDPKLGCVDWPAIRLKYADKLAGVTDRSEAYATINAMLQELAQSHFHLFDPAGAPDESVGPASPDLEARWIEDALIVVDSEADGVPAGSEIRAIDGKPFADAIDGAKRRSEAGVASFDSLVGRAAAARLSCMAAGGQHTLTLVDAQGVRRDAKIACVAPKGERITLGNLSNIPTVVEHRVIDGTKVGYLAFNIWMLPMVKRVEAALKDLRAQGIEALVLDLRGNPGGVGPMSVPVARLLLQKSGSLGKLQFRDFAQEFNVEASPDAFAGPVALLVDEGTASTSEIFAAGLRDLGRVEIFGGGPSAGAALPSVIEELEGGAILQYVVGDYHSPKGTVVEGTGIIPDVVVPETRKEFAAGKDPVLDAAVEHLSSGEGT